MILLNSFQGLKHYIAIFYAQSVLKTKYWETPTQNIGHITHSEINPEIFSRQENFRCVHSTPIG